MSSKAILEALQERFDLEHRDLRGYPDILERNNKNKEFLRSVLGGERITKQVELDAPTEHELSVLIQDFTREYAVGSFHTDNSYEMQRKREYIADVMENLLTYSRCKFLTEYNTDIKVGVPNVTCFRNPNLKENTVDLITISVVTQEVFDFFKGIRRGEVDDALLTQFSKFPEVKIIKGMKLTKALHGRVEFLARNLSFRLNNSDGYVSVEDLTSYLNWLTSKLIPQLQKNQVTLVLSTTLEDFLFMSMGGIYSCMSIYDGDDGGGCYSGGITGLAMDSTTIIAYAYRSIMDESIGDTLISTPRKIWRALMMTGAQTVVIGREFPSSHTGIAKAVRSFYMDTLANFYGVQNKWIVSKVYSKLNHHGIYYKDSPTRQATLSDTFLHYKENGFPIVEVGTSSICPICGRKHGNQEHIFCNDCFKKKEQNYCSYCDNSYDEDEVEFFYVSSQGESYCEYCIRDNFMRCERCDEFVHDDNTVHIEDIDAYYCERCADRYTIVCSKCGENVSQWEVIDGECYCENCAVPLLIQDSKKKKEEEEVIA